MEDRELVAIEISKICKITEPAAGTWLALAGPAE